MELHGKSVFGGIAMGRLSVYHKTDNAVKRTKITDIEAEKKRFEDAKEEAKRQLGVFYEKAVREVGEVNAAIFENVVFRYSFSGESVFWKRPQSFPKHKK